MSAAPAAIAPGTTTRLQGRARRLRSQATSVHPLLAEAYHRRAAELDLQAWLETVWDPPIHLRPLRAPVPAGRPQLTTVRAEP